MFRSVEGVHMEMGEILFRSGASGLILLGLSHLAAESRLKRHDPPKDLAETIFAMQTAKVEFPGREIPLYDLMRGFSLTMGLLFVGLGVVDHLIAALVTQSPVLLWVLVVLTALAFGLAYRYFFVLPIAVLFVCLFCFTGALVV